VDLNAGCPATKIVKRNAGAALLKDLKHFRLVVREMKKVTRRLSVKTRIGWDRDEFEHIYNILVEEGVDAIFVHGRTARQMYAGKASWNIYNHGDVPMYLSGDIYTREDIKRAIEVSGASGVIVARGSIGNPWIFSSLNDTGRNEHVGERERLSVVLRHLDYLEIEYGDYGAVVFRKYVAGYTKNLVGAREFRASVMNLDTIEKLKKSFTEYFSKLELERSSEYTSTGGNLE
jgi:tRNA-dihydrouridine synthase